MATALPTAKPDQGGVAGGVEAGQLGHSAVGVGDLEVVQVFQDVQVHVPVSPGIGDDRIATLFGSHAHVNP